MWKFFWICLLVLFAPIVAWIHFGRFCIFLRHCAAHLLLLFVNQLNYYARQKTRQELPKYFAYYRSKMLQILLERPEKSYSITKDFKLRKARNMWLIYLCFHECSSQITQYLCVLATSPNWTRIRLRMS